MNEKEIKETIKQLLRVKINLENKYPRNENGEINPNKEYDDAIRGCRIAIEALEKQIPVLIETWNGQASCPRCKMLYGNLMDINRLSRWDFDYCKRCGQKLDWSEYRRFIKF